MAVKTSTLPDPFDIARSGALYLASLTSPSGRFRYRFHHRTWRDYGGYNMVRHCGTIWSMCDVAAHVRCPHDVASAVERAIGYLRDVFLRRNGGRLDLVEGEVIKLGGNALGVLALLGAAKLLDRPELNDIAVEVGESILGDQMDDGDYVHKRFFESDKVSTYRSEYYTGEALLALMELHAVTGEARWLNSVVRAQKCLGPQDYGVKEQSHWMLYSLEALGRYNEDPAVYEHAKKIVRDIVDRPIYGTWNRSTPTACRSEGLLAFMRMLKGREDAAELRDEVMTAVRRNLAAQLTYREADGAFLRGGVKGQSRRQEVRIDYVQHNISSFLHFGLLAKREPRLRPRVVVAKSEG